MNIFEKSGQPRPIARMISRFFIFVFVVTALTGCSEGIHRPHFEIPEGYAKVTLKEFARQGEVEILFDLKIVDNVKTAAVSGYYDPHDALGLMLENTNLKYDIELETGAFAVSIKDSFSLKNPDKR